MAGKLFTTAQGYAWAKSLRAPNDDEHSDRLNHRYTVGFLLICATIATGTPFVMNRITCWVPAQFTGSYTSYTNNYCWISNTYYVPTNNTIPYDQENRKQAEIGYYQWTPFILLLFAFFFYLPRMLWRSMNTRSGMDLQFLVTKKDEKIVIQAIEQYCGPQEHKDSFGNRFIRTLFCTSGKRLGNYLRSVYLTVKVLYLVNSFIQLVVIHLVLGQPGWFYGIDIWRRIFIENSVLTDSPYFPRITLCDLRIREVGNLHRYTVQCVLPINMLNEKIFTLAWFWFIYVFISNLFSFLSTLYDTMRASHRINFIRDLYRISGPKGEIHEESLKNFTQKFLMQDGVLALEVLYRNGSPIVATKAVNELYSKYLKAQPVPLLRQLTPSPRQPSPSPRQPSPPSRQPSPPLLGSHV